MAQAKKGLGRGLAALIPTDDMDFLSGVARGDFDLAALADNLDTTTPLPHSKSNTLSKNQSQKAVRPSNVAAQVTTPNASDTVDVAKPEAAHATADEAADAAATPLRWLAVDAIVANPYQPRRVFDDEELQNLAASVREHGILQPIIVRPLDAANEAAGFQLVAGERRWRAAQLAGLSAVPALVRPVSDQQALELAVIENVQRHDISPLDAAQAYRRLATEFDLSQEKIARRVGKSRSSIANTMRLLELPIEARNALQDGTLSEGHGRAILLTAGEGARRAVFRAVLRDKLSVRDTEEMARRIAAGDLPPNIDDSTIHDPSGALTSAQLAHAAHHSELQQLAQQLQEATGCRVDFRSRRRGGQFVIHCSNNADASRLADLLPNKTV